MVIFGNFARIANLGVGFHLGTLHGYFFRQDYWPNLNFSLEHQIKLVLTLLLNMWLRAITRIMVTTTKSMEFY